MQERREQPMTSFATCSGLFALAFAVRCLSWPIVFGERGVFPNGFDAYYHLRRIVYTASHFPSSLSFDPYINHPEGAELHWSPLFDGALAMLARLLVHPIDREEVLQVLIWIPPLLGALTVVGTYLLSRRFFGGRAALFAGLLLALLPVHANYSAIGFIDHHVAVALTWLVLLAAAMSYLTRAPEASVTSTWMLALTLGALIALAFHLQPGMLLQVAILEAALLASFLDVPEVPLARTRALQLAACHLTAFALLAPVARVEWQRWGAFHPAVLSGFQPWLTGLLCVTYALLGALSGRLATRSWRLQATATIGLLLILASLWWIPELGANLEESLAIFGRGGVRSGIVESKPLFADVAAVMHATTRLSGVLVLLPVLFVAGVRVARRSERRAPLLLLVWCGLALFGAALVQLRYANSLSIPMVMLAGWAIEAWFRKVARREGRHRARLRIAGVTVIALCLAPLLHTYQPALQNLLRWRRSGLLGVEEVEVRKRILVNTARWLRDHSEPSPGFHDATGPPPYGVLTNWAHGNVVLYEAQRAVVASNFGDDVGLRGYALSNEYFRASPERAREILEDLRVRYVVSHTPREAFGPDSMHAHLYYLDGGESRGSFASDGRKLRSIAGPVSALTRHRLVYESLPMPLPGPRGRLPAFKIFEYVAGARVEGRAPARSTIAVELDLVSNRRRLFRWRASVSADELGRYTLVLPHATQGGPSAVRARGPYRVRLVGREQAWRQLRVPETAVRDGESLAGPDLRVDAGSAE